MFMIIYMYKKLQCNTKYAHMVEQQRKINNTSNASNNDTMCLYNMINMGANKESNVYICKYNWHIAIFKYEFYLVRA